MGSGQHDVKLRRLVVAQVKLANAVKVGFHALQRSESRAVHGIDRVDGPIAKIAADHGIHIGAGSGLGRRNPIPQSALQSGASAGPEITSPVGLNREP